MQVDREAVARSVLLGLVLLAPVALGVLIVHLGVLRWSNDRNYWMVLITVAVMWIYGMFEAGSKRGRSEVVLVALTMPFFFIALLYAPSIVPYHSGASAFEFLPWLFGLSLVSGHLYGRQIYTAMGACLVVTAFLTTVWYQETLYWALRRYFE